jgi:aryl-alcohol dehydrogenase-like predicted oxidoreductase
MPLDHYVTLGPSGLRVSPLCLGAMTFGEDLGWGSSVQESEQIIDRYLELGGNVSDTPAWKIVEANLTARFRGRSAFIGLQIEYSLLGRTVEQELVPMACELGLGITPWSPLKSGALGGKYTRQNAGQLKGDRGLFFDHFLNDRKYALIEELEAIAKAHDSTVARVAAGLAWRDVDDHRRAAPGPARG